MESATLTMSLYEGIFFLYLPVCRQVLVLHLGFCSWGENCKLDIIRGAHLNSIPSQFYYISCLDSVLAS